MIMNLLLTAILRLPQLQAIVMQCFSNKDMNTQWAQLLNGDKTITEFRIQCACCPAPRRCFPPPR